MLNKSIVGEACAKKKAMAGSVSTPAQGVAKPPLDFVRPKGVVLCNADEFNAAYLQLDRARGIVDLLSELSCAGLHEQLSERSLSSSLDALAALLEDAHSKLSGVTHSAH